MKDNVLEPTCRSPEGLTRHWTKTGLTGIWTVLGRILKKIEDTAVKINGQARESTFGDHRVISNASWMVYTINEGLCFVLTHAMHMQQGTM